MKGNVPMQPIPYTESELLNAPMSHLDRERIILTVKQGFAPSMPTDAELDEWANPLMRPLPGIRYHPSHRLNDAIRLMREFDVGLQLILKPTGELKAIAWRPHSTPRLAETLYEGLSTDEAAHAITLHLWQEANGLAPVATAEGQS